MRRIGLALVLGTGCLIDNPAWLGQGTDSSSGSGDGPDPAAFGCEPLPELPGDAIEVSPGDVAQLPQILADAPEGATIAFADGTYEVQSVAPLRIDVRGLKLRSAGGDASAVVIDGGTASPVIEIAADEVELGELRITGGGLRTVFVDAADGVVVYGVEFIDPGLHTFLAFADSTFTDFPENGTVGCSTFRRSVQLSGTDCDEDTAIEMEGGRNWSIFSNRIERFGCAGDVTEGLRPSLFLTGGARDSIVVRNLFVNCPRAVVLGHNMEDQKRAWPDAPCTGAETWGHIGGIVANNMAWVGDPGITPDSMFSVWDCCDVRMYHNTAVLLGDGFNGFEHRWPTNSATIVNNLTNGPIAPREGSTAIVEGNIEAASLDDFVDAFSGDLHLRAGAAAVGQGLSNLGGIDLGPDFDGDERDAEPDVGADELAE